MTVPVEASQSLFTGNGVTTVFNTGFYFLDDDEVVVRITPLAGVEVIKTKGVHYTVTMPAGIGLNGSITMLVAPAVNDAIVIERTLLMKQEMSLRNQGSFSPAIHEDAFDRAVFRDQQLSRRLSALESAGAAGSVVAGSGLAFIGDTLHVGAGPGVFVDADTVEVIYGEAADIAALDGTITGGVLDKAARADHQHAISGFDVPVDFAIGAANSAGASSLLARADHVHGVAAPAAPANVTKAAAAAGVSTAAARADHKHDITTAAAVSLTDAANAEGAAASLARSDHTHAHGNRGGGTLHANAVAGGAAGFMSGADKATIDALGSAALKSKVTGSSTAPQSIATATPTVFTGFTETLDADNEFDPATGVYTAKAAGNVLALGVAVTANVLWAAGSLILVEIRKNGAAVGAGAYHFVDAAATRIVALEGTRFFSVAIGDTIDVRITHNQGGNVNISAYVAIARFL